MLEGGVDRDGDRGAGREVQLGAQQSRERGDRGAVPEQFTHEHAHGGIAVCEGRRGEVLEERRRVARMIGQRDPELHAVEAGGGIRRDLGMLDAGPRRHQVHRARLNERHAADAVAVLDLARVEPTDGLEPGVRMRRHIHRAAPGHRVRAVAVDEAPGSDEAALLLRQGPAHRHRPGAAERHLARFEKLDPFAIGHARHPSRGDWPGAGASARRAARR